MPMKKDPGNGGTNADGTRSTDYCSHCYEGGAFTSPEIRTAADMQKFCIGKLKEKGAPGFLAWAFTRNIPRLKRWQTH
jgi:hypothetical protein